MSSSTLWDHARALAVLLVGFLLLMAGFPGLDFVNKKQLEGWAAEARARSAPAGAVAGGVLWFEEEVRRPVAKAVKPAERLFRISQEFHLYRDGPRRVDRLEIVVDGEVVYRTRDPERDWRTAQLENRHFRPMAATAAQKPDAANQRGICRWVVARVQEDFPDAQEVLLRATRTEFGVEDPWVRFSRVARAPEWTCSGVRKEKAP
jgi:hypothetical protein